MSKSEKSCVYAALILQDDGIEITSDKLQAIVKAANVNVEPIWFNLFASALQGQDLKELLFKVGSGGGGGAVPAAGGGVGGGTPAAKKEEVKEESDEDMGFGLFD